MTIADAVLLVSVVLLTLIALSVMKELIALRGEVRAVFQLVTNPPAPAVMGSSVPQELAEILGALPETPGAFVVIFMSEACSGCETLAEALAIDSQEGRLDPKNVVFIVSGGRPSFARRLSAAGFTLYSDNSGAVFEACQIRGTPTSWGVWRDSLVVFDFKFGADPEWTRDAIGRTSDEISITKAGERDIRRPPKDSVSIGPSRLASKGAE